jgi:hypothetical protein
LPEETSQEEDGVSGGILGDDLCQLHNSKKLRGFCFIVQRSCSKWRVDALTRFSESLITYLATALGVVAILALFVRVYNNIYVFLDVLRDMLPGRAA